MPMRIVMSRTLDLPQVSIQPSSCPCVDCRSFSEHDSAFAQGVRPGPVQLLCCAKHVLVIIQQGGHMPMLIVRSQRMKTT